MVVDTEEITSWCCYLEKYPVKVDPGRNTLFVRYGKKTEAPVPSPTLMQQNIQNQASTNQLSAELWTFWLILSGVKQEI